MRNGQNGRRRGRGPNNRPAPGGNRSLDTSRQDARARGNAQQLLEKYKNMARDAASSGDRILSEYYMQHADHYFRVLADYRARYEDQRPRERGVGEVDEPDFEEDGDGGDDGFEGQAPQRQNGRANDEERRARDQREDRQRDERSRDDRGRDDRYDRARPDERQRDERMRDDRARGERIREDRLQDDPPAGERVRDERLREERHQPLDARGEGKPARHPDADNVPVEARATGGRRAAEPDANAGFDEMPRFMRRPEELTPAPAQALAELPVVQADIAPAESGEAPVRRRRGRPRNSERTQAAAEEATDAG